GSSRNDASHIEKTALCVGGKNSLQKWSQPEKDSKTPGTIAGIVLGDLFLTLLIALGVYYVVSCIYKQQSTSSGKEERFPHPQCTLSP
uniref:DNAX-activation protein 10 n=1 Tax=Laticauda laticaudata TaxID=8630 RepID=A0A8C5SW69_LATLA